MPTTESNQVRGQRAEEFIAEQYNLARKPAVEWYDAVNPRTGAKYEIKSAAADRMFRFWRDQHHAISGADGQGTGWYALVVMGDGGQPARWRRVKPSTIAAVISDRGGFNKQTHRRSQQQKKVPVSEFF